ncbi:hypothetical protein F8S09_17020 [Deinococcus sp. SDU3-2]|uniref:Uncharacterized protein n=1 Tax=Deinococcus terrestris TaxID=2651870 RepID=A0A7X1NZ31_9DEIO|nr:MULTISPECIES: hypothetical protein [Deinococcus]MPY68358.1 hypothetical protein [Deinococcus terrestris]
MAYVKLSDQLQKLSDPQRSDAFVKQFREAVRTGQFDAAELPERFDLPKQFRRRGSDETYQRQIKDMIFESSPEFDEWFSSTDQELASTGRRTTKPKPTAENIEAGVIDFKALAEETRRKMQASYEKGQTLGQSRAKTATKSTKSTRAKRTTKK